MPTLTVLVVDDEVQIRRVVRNVLGSDGTRVIEAETGQQGIDLAAAQRPDLIVLDLGLPDMSGANVCREKFAVGPRPQSSFCLPATQIRRRQHSSTSVLMTTSRSLLAPSSSGTRASSSPAFAARTAASG